MICDIVKCVVHVFSLMECSKRYHSFQQNTNCNCMITDLYNPYFEVILLFTLATKLIHFLRGCKTRKGCLLQPCSRLDFKVISKYYFKCLKKYLNTVLTENELCRFKCLPLLL